MKKKDNMPIDVKSYISNTLHLTTQEHGAYFLLLAVMWRRNGALPDCDKSNARITRLTKSKWLKVKDSLREFFIFSDGRMRSIALSEWEEMLRKKASRPAIPTDIRNHVFERDGERCVYCGNKNIPFHLDHVLPWSRGGKHTTDNLVVSCQTCNLKKGDRTPDEMGWVQ